MIEKQWNLNRISDQIQLRAIQKKRPLSCMLELTYHCNFHCRMCYIRMTDEQAAPYGRLRTVEEWLDMARQLYDAGVLYLTITGGECTTYPGFVKLYEQLAQMGFRIAIMTNAGAYTDSIRDVFSKYPPNSVGITLYGASADSYKAVTGSEGGFERVLENIRFFKSINVPVVLNYTMIRQNVLDYPKIGKLCRQLGCEYKINTDITIHRYNTAYSEALDCRLSPAERYSVLSHKPDEVKIALAETSEYEDALNSYKNASCNEELSSDSDACIGSITGCAIAWNGNMNTCISLMGLNDVKPFDIGFEAAWKQLKSSQEELFKLPNKCRSCSMSNECMNNCVGRRYEGMRTVKEPDSYTCQYTYLLSHCKRNVDEDAVSVNLSCN